MADPAALSTLRDRLSRRWPGLMQALPSDTRLVRQGGNIGLLDHAVVLRQDWLKQRDLDELQRALLHLAAHAALGHRPWHVRQPEQHARLDREATDFLCRLGIDEKQADWQNDHHGQWREANASEPGLDRQGQAARNRPGPPPRQRDTSGESEASTTGDEPETFERMTRLEQGRSPDRPGTGRGSRNPGAGTATPAHHPIDRDWRRLLQVWLSQRAWRNWHFDRPPRHNPEPFILPRLSGRDLNLVIALDISGSISDHWLHGFLTEIGHLRRLMPMRLRLITCDNRIHSDRRDITRLDIALNTGGGGTDFRPVFERLLGDATIDALLYCTDLVGEFPLRAPSFPVFWLTPTTDRRPPFGNHLSLDLA